MWEGRFIQAFVTREKSETMNLRMGTDYEVSQNATMAKIPLLTPALGIGLKGSGRDAPHFLSQFPINHNCGLLQEFVEKSLRTARCCQ